MRTKAASARDRVCSGHASTTVVGVPSRTGTHTRSRRQPVPRRDDRHPALDPERLAVEPRQVLAATRGGSVRPARWVRAVAAATASRTLAASLAGTSPAAVSETPRLDRSNNLTPRRRSSFWIARDNGGYAIPSRSAALPKCSSSATARK
ncbi:hypothetical protein ACQEVF_54790 [Nonomuraea polychroma]|uniref:hypothetical protein n=1 Tax=Nonomuraea polychroma TaxID=46176 RepID=UPI003D94A84A